MKKLRSQQGFTLFEILLATGLFAVASVIALNGVLFATDLKIRDKNLLRAAFLANQKMVELEMQLDDDLRSGLFPDEKSESGAFEGEDETFSWEYNIRKIEIPMQKGDETNAIALAVIKKVFDEISKSVREVNLKVTWVADVDKEEPEVVQLTTHIVKLK